MTNVKTAVLLLLVLAVFAVHPARARSVEGEPEKSSTAGAWPGLPRLSHGDALTLTNEQDFLRVAGAAAVSYVLLKFVLPPSKHTDYWQLRSSHAVGEGVSASKLHLGVERRMAAWYAVSLELSIQRWHDQRAGVPSGESRGFGIGLQPYFRWYFMGERRFSPYLEYGTGFFQGLKKFPYDGTRFTFTHSSHLGVEYIGKKRDRWRLSYGQFHQSNNDWWDVNPSFNGNGLNITYVWEMR